MGEGGRPDAGAEPAQDRAGEVEPPAPEARSGPTPPGGGGKGSAPGAPEVIVALDFPGATPAQALVERLPPGTWYKVGLELFTAAGPDFVRELAAAGHPVFLDLKLHDIPNTVEGAVRSVAGLGARLLTVHAGGGREMISAAVEAAGSDGSHTGRAAGSHAGSAPSLRILAVTVLTSLDDEGMEEVMGFGGTVEEGVGRLAVLAQEAGAHGVVASVEECRAVKALCGGGFRVATPGIRLAGGEAHDQKRVATPAEAAAAGADYLVVGRAVTRADDPAAALRRVRAAATEGVTG